MGDTKDIPTRELLDGLHTRIEAGAVDWCEVQYLRGMVHKWYPDNRADRKLTDKWLGVVNSYPYLRVVSVLDGWQCGRFFKYLPRAVIARFVLISDDNHLKWDNGGRREFGGFVKLLLNKDGRHRIPYKRIGNLFLFNRVDRAVDAYMATPKCDDITAMLETGIFFN